MLADRCHCYPLTTSDCASRNLISCEALATARKLSSSPPRTAADERIP